MHLGSLYTALAGYIDARSHQGKWLLRIDDIDTPRNVFGASDDILKTLERFGLNWDEGVYYQSRHSDLYRSHLQALETRRRIYPCTCSRKTLARFCGAKNPPEFYPGICRNKKFPESSPHAIRILVENSNIEFFDSVQGRISRNLADEHGDFIIQRKDRIFAYQFAVVIDDHEQKINRIVRGADLLESTPRQIYLHRQLGFNQPAYMHIPVITDRHGNKLSKQTFARAIDKSNPGRVIFNLLELLRQSPPVELADYPLSEILNWGIEHWNPASLTNVRTICPITQ